MQSKKKRNWRRKFAYWFFGLLLLLIVVAFAGIQYAKYQIFKDRPNRLTFVGDLHPVPFQWSEDRLDDFIEPHSAMLIPVTIAGIENKFFMQLDTGGPSSFLRSGALKELRSHGVQFQLSKENDRTCIETFELNVGNNRVILKSGDVMGSDAKFNWDNPNAINIIGSFGADFIDQKVCEIDFPNQQIRLHKSRPDNLNSLGTFTPFKFKGRRVMLPTTIDNVQMELFYDSGCSAFGLLTSKYHFERYADKNSKEISYNANRHGDPVFIHHKTCGLEATFGDVKIPLTRVSYAELYTFVQSSVGRLIHGGFLGNKPLLECCLILDTLSNEFLIVCKQ